MCNRLDKLKKVFSYVRPENSYYIFPKIIISKKIPLNLYKNNIVNSWEFALYLLEKVQVAVVPGYAFGPNGEGHIRLSFGRSMEDIKIAMDRLDKLFL